ncbi:MAG: TolC family protein [Bacteroidetes bacterium]|nr:TolC family protein [Bacteroidota bacterium]
MIIRFGSSLLLCAMVIASNEVQAQESLSLSKAIETAIQQNFYIKTVRNTKSVAENNNTIGNAGWLPSVDIGASVSTSSANTEQEYTDGRVVNSDNAGSDNIQAGAALIWTLFDGLQMFATKNRLNTESILADVDLKIQVENLTATIIGNYFNIVRINQQIKVTVESISIYEDRLKIAEAKFRIGSASKLEALQTKVDLNAAKSRLMLLQIEKDKAVTALFYQMGIKNNYQISLSDSVKIDYQPQYAELLKSIPQTNKEIKYQELKYAISTDVIREMKAMQLPVLNLNMNYNYNRTENEVGFLLLNQTQGYNAGLTLSWNLFNGLNTRRQINNAKLFASSENEILESVKLRIENDLWLAFRNFETEKELLQMEISNTDVVRENVTVALEAYRLGTISGLQLKDAQNAFEEAMSRVADAHYRTKLAETELMKLNGDLLK